MLLLYFVLGLGVATVRTAYGVTIRPEYPQPIVQDLDTAALDNHQIDDSSVKVNFTNDTTSGSLKGVDNTAKDRRNRILKLFREASKGLKQDPTKIGVVSLQKIPNWTSASDEDDIGNHQKENSSVGNLTNDTTSDSLNINVKGLANKPRDSENRLHVMGHLPSNGLVKQDPKNMGCVTRQMIPDWTGSDEDTAAIGNHHNEKRAVSDVSLANDTASGSLNINEYRLATSSEREAAIIKIADELNDLDVF